MPACFALYMCIWLFGAYFRCTQQIELWSAMYIYIYISFDFSLPCSCSERLIDLRRPLSTSTTSLSNVFSVTPFYYSWITFFTKFTIKWSNKKKVRPESFFRYLKNKRSVKNDFCDVLPLHLCHRAYLASQNSHLISLLLQSSVRWDFSTTFSSFIPQPLGHFITRNLQSVMCI